MGHPHNSTRWLPSLWTRQETLGWQVVCSRRKREASSHVLATNTLTIILCRHASLDGMVGQMLKCEWWVRVGLMCAVCYPCNHVYMVAWCVPSATHVIMYSLWSGVYHLPLFWPCVHWILNLWASECLLLFPPKQFCTQHVPLLLKHSSQSRYSKVHFVSACAM